MLFDLRKMTGTSQHVERRYPPTAFAGGDEFVVRGDVVLAFDIERGQDRYHLVGTAATTLELTCSRCAEPFSVEVAPAFDLRYLPQSANAGEGEREVEEEDLSTAYYRDQAIHLGELIREQFTLLVPMKPLCRADCRGLCPSCGVNRNVSTCQCDPHWEDPRLAGLRALIDERKD
jgi:uncharacterized metal-binding protein YceD (DUF177 family)